ncbi:TIR domain-containing protein [Mycobacterium sp. OTB74]|uniref:nSTAND1 domain-containing NTPase n=1 Tax=Mycobacterium sp. OTB74 TaxID=1853452 RepID=UPI002473E55E|nr:TIR domain-containing protein [Mycobacterium sp. OTB74]MDH6247818.1 WD40 repeat protein [Mycobacterium sp. OTB74]
MSRVFLSHSRWDSRAAIAVKQWLIEQESGLVDEIYLDVDPRSGIRPGERWKEALNKASNRCEAVICLLSERWLNSAECAVEFRYAENLHKVILCARLELVPDTNITSEWQRCDLFPDGGATIEVDINDGDRPIVLNTAGLQRLLNGLRALGIGAGHFPWPPPSDPNRAPYRGWAPLEAADAAVFFGRDTQILRGLDVLRGMRAGGVGGLFVILGPSGAGKSSFLRAGLLPRLRRDDRRFIPMPIVRPEQAALTGQLGIACSIHQLRSDLGLSRPLVGEIKKACDRGQVEYLCELLAEARQKARDQLLDMPAEHDAPTLVLPIDQGEELFNVDAGPEAERFLELLAALLVQETGDTAAMIAVVTIRADRYEPLQLAPSLADVNSVVFDQLRPLQPAGYTEVITGPARRATAAGAPLEVEPELVDRLLAETAHSADALPLLSLTLERLYYDFGADGDLAVAEYEIMGGLSEVVQTEVDKLLDTDPEQRQAQLDLLHDAFIPWLATINPDSNEPMRRLARWDDLPAGSRPLIQRMVEKRLLVKDLRDGQTVVEVALESLLRQWHELRAWLRDEAQHLKDADTLERAAADWEVSGQNESWLLAGTRLTDAETLSAKPGFRDRLDPVNGFLRASRAHEDDRIETERQRREAELQAAKEHAVALRKRSRILAAVLAVTTVIAMVAVVLGVAANNARNQADSARRETDARFREATSFRLVSDAESMLAGSRAGGSIRAYQQLLASRQLVQPPVDGPLLTALRGMVALIKVVQAPDHVARLAFSPDGCSVVSNSGEPTVWVWNTDTGKPVGAPLTGHTAAVWSVAFSPDGRRVATGSADKTVRVWDAHSGQPVGHPIAVPSAVNSVAFSPDGSRLVSGTADGTVRVWTGDTGQPVGPPMTVANDSVDAVAFSPDGHKIAAAGFEGTVRVWGVETGKQIGPPLTGHTGSVSSVAFSPNGHRIVSGSYDKTVRLWDADTNQPLGQAITGHGGAVESVAFSPDSERVASGSDDKTVRVWDANTGKSIGSPLTGHLNAVLGVAFSSDGGRIVSGGMDNTVRVWDAHADQRIVEKLMGHTDSVNSVAFSPRGERIVSGSVDKTVRIWDVHTGTLVGHPLTGHTNFVSSVAFSPDGHTIVSGSYDMTVRLWDADTGQPKGPPLTGHTGAVMSVAFGPDGRIVSGGADGTVRLWDAHSGKQIGASLIGHTDTVSSIAFSRDGHRIVSGGADQTVRLWDADSAKAIGQPIDARGATVLSVAWSPDRRIAAGGTVATVPIWDADSGNEVGVPLAGHTNAVFSVAFSPDGKRIVSGSADNTVRLWDVDSDQPLGAAMTGHTDSVNTVAFSPDGNTIASGATDKTIRLWPAFPDPVPVMCSKLASNMSHKQWREWVSPNIEYITGCPGLPVASD